MTLVPGQRVFARGLPGVIVDSAAGQVSVELADGELIIVAEGELVQAENAASVKQRQGER